MVVRRPKISSRQDGDGSDDDGITEHLVRRSLAVNPSMRDGRTTHQVMDNMRAEAVQKAGTPRDGTTPAGLTGSATGSKSATARLRQTIEFFFEQKSLDYRDLADELDERLRALEIERAELRDSIAGELLDFLSLMAGGGDSPEARAVFKQYRPRDCGRRACGPAALAGINPG